MCVYLYITSKQCYTQVLPRYLLTSSHLLLTILFHLLHQLSISTANDDDVYFVSFRLSLVFFDLPVVYTDHCGRSLSATNLSVTAYSRVIIYRLT